MNEARKWGRRGGARKPRVFRVGEVNRAIRDTLQERFPDFWVEGEVHGYKRSSAGHVYFTLSDEQEVAQLSCVLFRTEAERVRIDIRDGARIRTRGSVTFFPPRGNAQFMARVVVAAGAGDLAARFDGIRKTLDAEGLLDAARKRPLPRFPRVVGVVTSQQSAAVQDIIRIASSRARTRLVLVDCRTQGRDAPMSIIDGLRRAQAMPDLDVVILGRGGGSPEELWCFNDERVARAVAACRVPIVVGVGHETDVTIAELVADVRASTPSNAAELAVPRMEDLSRDLELHQRRLQIAFATQLDAKRLMLERIASRLIRPGTLLSSARRRLTQVAASLPESIRATVRHRRRRLDKQSARLARLDPRASLARDRGRLKALRTRLESAMQTRAVQERNELGRTVAQLGAWPVPALRFARSRLGQQAARLNALSPLRVLERGYAIALHEGEAIRSHKEVTPGATIRVRLHDGSLVAKVSETEAEA